jgi:hypothetical protein
VTRTGANVTAPGGWADSAAGNVAASAKLRREIRIGGCMVGDAQPKRAAEKGGVSRALKKRRNPRLLFPSSA